MSLSLWLIFSFGLVFVISAIVLAIKFENPTPFQEFVFRTVLALSCAGVAAIIPGFLEIESQIGKTVLRAGGALAVFLLIYRINPAKLITTPIDTNVSSPEVVVNLLNLARQIESHKNILKQYEPDRRIKVADYLENIAQCIDRIIATQRSTHSRRQAEAELVDACSELRVYARNLPGIVKDVVPKEEMDSLISGLRYAGSARVAISEQLGQLGFRFNRREVRRKALKQLGEAAGLFKGVSKTLRALA